jgi:hypothetical protein
MDHSTELRIVSVVHGNNLGFAFHRNSIAYTVSSVQPEPAWLLPVLQSWVFTD